MAFSGRERIIAAIERRLNYMGRAPDEGIPVSDFVQEMYDTLKGMRSGSLGFTVKKVPGFFQQHLDYHDSPPVFEIQS
jgi:hypothetical protein